MNYCTKETDLKVLREGPWSLSSSWHLMALRHRYKKIKGIVDIPDNRIVNHHLRSGMSKRNPFEYVKNINTKKGYDYDLSGYVPFLTNRAFAGFIDTIMFVEQMNQAHASGTSASI